MPGSPPCGVLSRPNSAAIRAPCVLARRHPDGVISRRAFPDRAALTLHRFVQLDYAGLVGLPEGRYLARPPEGERVLLVSILEAPRGGRRRRKVRPAQAGGPQAVPVTRITTTAGEAGDEPEAAAWVERTAGDPRARAAAVREAVILVNRALGALRAGAADPLVQDVGATRALAIRIGYGSGEELAAGRWSEARELPEPRRGRLDDVEPQSRVAAVLAGRDSVHPAETLLLRARLDLEMGRPEEARHGARAARAALEADPPSERRTLEASLAELEERL